MRLSRLTPKAWSVMSALHMRGEASRSQLTVDTGLPWATLSRTVDELSAYGLLEETRMGRVGKAGPQSVLLRVNGEAGYLFGIDVGATNIKVAAMNLALQPMNFSFPMLQTGKNVEEVIQNIRTCVREILMAVDANDILGIGLGWPGAVDYVQGIAQWSPNIQGYSELAVKDMLSEEQLRTLGEVPIVIDHDTECTALAEKEIGNHGRPRTQQNFLCVTVGTGVGAGLVHNGSVFRGARNYAGEIGHFLVNETASIKCGCGRVGCLEKEISGPDLARKWRERNPDSLITAEQIARLAHEGDSNAIALFREMGRWLGRALSYCVNLNNYELIILNGAVSGSFDLFSPSLKNELSERAFRSSLLGLRIEATSVGTNAAAFGAAISVLDHFKTLPYSGRGR